MAVGNGYILFAIERKPSAIDVDEVRAEIDPHIFRYRVLGFQRAAVTAIPRPPIVEEIDIMECPNSHIDPIGKSSSTQH